MTLNNKLGSDDDLKRYAEEHVNMPSPNATHLDFLQKIRREELSQAITYFPPPQSNGYQRTVLEIGAGTGQQAEMIKKLGYAVTAIDLPSSHYAGNRIFNVIDYDGRTIPTPTASIDIVFSSNVLEHVHEIDDFLDEVARVMAGDAIAVHVLPSSACRAWGILGHYIWLFRRISAYIISRIARHQHSVLSPLSPRRPTSSMEWVGTFFPLRHGERGITITEPYYYSRHWWKRKFLEHGFTIIKIEGNHIFYSLANALAGALSIKNRKRLSCLLGSACNIYVLKRQAHINIKDMRPPP